MKPITPKCFSLNITGFFFLSDSYCDSELAIKSIHAYFKLWSHSFYLCNFYGCFPLANHFSLAILILGHLHPYFQAACQLGHREQSRALVLGGVGVTEKQGNQEVEYSVMKTVRLWESGAGREGTGSLQAYTFFITKSTVGASLRSVHCSVACKTQCFNLSVFQFILQEVDITLPENATWYERYKFDIPVFHLNGQFLMMHRVNTSKLEKQLLKLEQRALETN